MGYTSDEAQVTLIADLHPRQLMEAIHSNGAMLLRVNPITMQSHPTTVPFFMMETARDRQYPRPLLLLRSPLANYSMTLETARNESIAEKLGGLCLLVSSFIRSAPCSRAFYRQAWRIQWLSGRGALRALCLGALRVGRVDLLLAGQRPFEVMLFFAWCLRHPIHFMNTLRYMRRNRDLEEYLRLPEKPPTHIG